MGLLEEPASGNTLASSLRERVQNASASPEIQALADK
jgi:hypothetical protein